MNNSFKMNGYNFRPVDKSNTPVSQDITKQLQTGPNVLRMFFTSTDNISGNTNTPSFNIHTNIFQKFDPNRPIYFVLDYFFNTSGQLPSNMYNLVWLNMPSSHNTWYSNNAYKNILGTIQGNGSNFYTRPMPYVLNQQDIVNMGIMQFALVDFQHNLLSNNQTSNIMFAVCFFQQ